MAAPPVRIRIGAALDSASVERAFASVEKRAAKAQVVQARQRAAGVQGERKAAADTSKVWDRQLRELNRIAREQDRLHMRMAARAAREQEQSARRQEQAARRAARETERAEERKRRELQRTAREAERQLRREQQARERAARRAGESFARRTSHRTTRFLAPEAPLGSIALRTARNLAHGAGVQMDMGSMIGRTIEQEELATKISTKAFRPGQEGIAGTRVDPRELIKEARETAFATGGDTTETLQGLFAFTSQSGDLAAARASMESLAKLAKSQGADFEQTFFAAGKINNALEQQPEFMHDAQKRGQEIFKIMKLLIAQTKIGSVEFEKMGVQIPKIAGIAGLFQGGTDRSLGQLATVVQVAEKGQAKDAALASTQTQNLALDLQTGAAAKRFKAMGIDTIDSKTGRTRELRAIILDVLKVAEKRRQEQGIAESTTITTLMPNKRAMLPLMDFLSIFREAGGGASGAAAIEKTFRDFSTTIGDEQLTGDLDASLKTTRALVNRFNVQVEDVGDNIKARLAPQFERLAPKLLELVQKLGNITTWVVDNPKTAIATAIGLSVARAGIESVLRASIERAILGQDGTRAGKVGRVVGGLGAVGGAVGVGLALGTIGSMTVENMVARNLDLQQEARAKSGEAFELEKRAEKLMQRGDEEGARKLLFEAKEKRTEASETILKEEDRGFGEKLVLGLQSIIDPESVKAATADRQARFNAQQKALEDTRELLRELNRRIASGVHVNNMPEEGLAGRAAQ